MIKKIIFSIVLVIAIMTSAYFVHAQDVKHKSFASYEEIIEQDKPAVLYFYSDSCTYCNEVFPVYKELSKEFKNKFVFGVANVYDKKNYYIMNKLRVFTIPAIYIYNGENKGFTKIPVYMYQKDNLRKVFERYSNK